MLFLTKTTSHKVKVIKLLAVTHDILLDLAGVDPSDEILHITSDQESGIVHNLCSDTDMTLLDESRSLNTNSQHNS